MPKHVRPTLESGVNLADSGGFQFSMYSTADPLGGEMLAEIGVDRPGLEMLVSELTRLLGDDRAGEVTIWPNSIGPYDEKSDRVEILRIDYEPQGWPQLRPKSG